MPAASAAPAAGGTAPQELPVLEVTGTRENAPAPTALPTPAAEQTISPAILGNLDFKDLQSISNLVPNVSLNEADGPRSTSMAIRGGQELTFHEFGGGRTSVAYYLDDIPFLDAYGRQFGMFAADGVSLYKGPHGTHFGVPGPMGLLDVTTRRPGSAFEGEVSYTYGSDDLHRGRIYTGGEIAPGLLLGIDLLHAESEGWSEDRFTGGPYGRTETDAALARLIWQVSDRLELTFTAGYERHDDDPVAYYPHDTSSFYKVGVDPDASATGWQAFQALRALWKGDGWQLKSITSHRDADFKDRDTALLFELFNPGALFRVRGQEISAWSQEIRAESTDPAAEWRWRTGLFFSGRRSTLDHFILGLGPWEGTNELDYDFEEWAAYGEIIRPIGPHLELSGGLRLQLSRDHTRSSFDPTALAGSLGGVAFTTDSREDYTAALPMAGAEWKWTDTQSTYFRFSTAMQPGGAAVAAGGSREYDAEHSFHYELGHRSSFLEGKVDLTAAAFYTDYRDYLAFQFHPAGQTVFNVDDAHAWGLEAALRVRPTEELEFYAGVGYTHATYDDYATVAGDFSGNRIAKIPSYTLNAGASYRAKWGGVAAINWRFMGKTYFDDANQFRQGAYSLLDARIGYEKGNFGIYVFGRNLSDTSYFTHTYVFFGQPASSPGPPRMIGTEIRATF